MLEIRAQQKSIKIQRGLNNLDLSQIQLMIHVNPFFVLFFSFLEEFLELGTWLKNSRIHLLLCKGNCWVFYKLLFWNMSPANTFYKITEVSNVICFSCIFSQKSIDNSNIDKTDICWILQSVVCFSLINDPKRGAIRKFKCINFRFQGEL